ncbi:protein NinF [Escherichia coli]
MTGVYFNKERCKWIANICVDGRTKYLGIFASIIDAIAERKKDKKNWVFMKTMADHNCAELMSDPNSSMYEEEDDE